MKKEISLRRSRIDYAKSVVMHYVEHFAKFLSALVEEENLSLSVSLYSSSPLFFYHLGVFCLRSTPCTPVDA